MEEGLRPARPGVVVDTSRSPRGRVLPLPISAVRLEGGFWGPRLRTIREVALRHQYEQLEHSGALHNFRRAAGRASGEFRGLFFLDSDVYKWLEAASFALAGEPDAELGRLVDAVAAEVAAAQAPDGYLHTYFVLERAAERWSERPAEMFRRHELYCAGHLLQAAVAHHRATGKDTLLDVAVRLADHIGEVYGPGRRAGTGGHPEIEMALVELYREVGRRDYLDLAGFFLDQRGRRPPVLTGEPYLQDHLPVREQAEIVGHAVMAAYLACGMADVHAETGDPGLFGALERLWRSAFTRKVYLTGGLGSRWLGESFGDEYELPNERAYAETCAAIGGLMWNWRMLLLTGQARYADWMELALYNGILVGVSLGGTEYFYQNPLADRGGHRRRAWFDCACCPPNLARLLMSLGGYAYGRSAEGLWVHLYVAGRVRAATADGNAIACRCETDYPRDGEIRLTIEAAPDGPASLFLRIPAWCGAASVRVNGRTSEANIRAGAYAEVHRAWAAGDVVELSLAMPVRRVASHPRVLANTGRVALMRGPLVYCAEGVDHPGADVWQLELPAGARMRADLAPGMLGGVVAIRGEAVAVERPDWGDELYRSGADGVAAARRPTELVAVPYYAWANRAPGPMQVWLRTG